MAKKTEKGMWYSTTEKMFSEIGDAKIDAKGFFEWADGPMLLMAFSTLDNQLLDRLIKSEEIKVELREMFKALVEIQDMALAVELAIELQQKVANIQGFDDEFEREIVRHILNAGVNIILKWINDGKPVYTSKKK